jgi:hypothetical protein
MTGNTPKNVFEAVGRSQSGLSQFSKKKELPIEEQKTLPITAMLEHCRKLHEDIASSLNRMFTEKGITHNQYRNYVSEQKNFSKAEWDLIEETKKQTENQLKELQTGTKSIPKEDRTPASKKETKKPPGEHPEMKRRPITKRQWLQMH